MKRKPKDTGKWPRGDLPPLTQTESAIAARRLYRSLTGFPAPVKLKAPDASGGWPGFAAEMTHAIYPRVYAHNDADSPMVIIQQRAHLGRLVISTIVRRGWLTGDGVMRPLRPKLPLREKRRKLAVRRQRLWQTRLKRAQTMLKKATARVRYYDRTTSPSAPSPR